MRTILIIFASLLLVIVGGWLVLDRLNMPQKSVMSPEQEKKALGKMLGREAVLEAKKAGGWKVYSGREISFSYPGDLIVQKSAQSARVLESFQGSMSSPRIVVAVQVVDASDLQKIEEYSAVAVRQNQKEVYKMQRGELAFDESLIFTKDTDEGVEKSAFLLRSGKVYSIVVSGYHLDEVEEIFEKVEISIKLIE